MRAFSERARHQASFCDPMGSAFSAALLRNAATEYESGGAARTFFDENPQALSGPRVSIRLLGALHYIALSGSDPTIAAHYPSCGGDGDAAAAWARASRLIEEDPQRVSVLLARTPQTNEVARSMPLLGAILAVVGSANLPVRLLEIGASAGLNSRLDAYRYEGAGWTWGPRSSPLVLRNRQRSGEPKFLDAALEVVERAACDVHPLDVTSPEDRAELRSFIWADQLERLERFEHACEAAKRIPLRVEKADAIEWTERNFAPRQGEVTILMHSAFRYYITADEAQRLDAAIARGASRATVDAPVAHIALEEDGRGFSAIVERWPVGGRTLVARCDGHGQDIEWTTA